MRRGILIVFSMVMMLVSCENEPVEPTPSTVYLNGSIEEVMEGTNDINSFAIKLKAPNDDLYEVIVNDTTIMDDFIVGQKATVKGELTNSIVQVSKIISTDSETFELLGKIDSKTPNESGYSCIVIGNLEEEYDANFSISNIGEDYQEFEVGDSVSVNGELWVSEEKLCVTVKVIK